MKIFSLEASVIRWNILSSQQMSAYGALIVDPADPGVDAAYDYDHEVVLQLQEWLEREGLTYPAMPMEGALPNFFTINGKSYPDTETLQMKVGERVGLRFVGSHNNFVHPMHVHGGPFTIVETDGNPVPEAARLQKDVINVGPGERYESSGRRGSRDGGWCTATSPTTPRTTTSRRKVAAVSPWSST